jgi:hypothetical protein
MFLLIRSIFIVVNYQIHCQSGVHRVQCDQQQSSDRNDANLPGCELLLK